MPSDSESAPGKPVAVRERLADRLAPPVSCVNERNEYSTLGMLVLYIRRTGIGAVNGTDCCEQTLFPLLYLTLSMA